jgi:hypothetical protein
MSREDRMIALVNLALYFQRKYFLLPNPSETLIQIESHSSVFPFAAGRSKGAVPPPNGTK